MGGAPAGGRGDRGGGCREAVALPTDAEAPGRRLVGGRALLAVRQPGSGSGRAARRREKHRAPGSGSVGSRPPRLPGSRVGVGRRRAAGRVHGPWAQSPGRTARATAAAPPQVHGVKGVFLANQKKDGKVVTLITYNKGRDWDRLRPPSVDMNGKPTNCQPVSGPHSPLGAGARRGQGNPRGQGWGRPSRPL